MIFVIVSCASSKQADLQAGDIPGAYQRAMEYFEKKNWIKAEEAFTFIIYNDPAGEYSDDAQYYLAETHFMREEYLLAINEYDRLLSRMPNSPLVEDALWRKTESYVELSPDYRLERDLSDKAIKYLQEFMDYYPDSKHISYAVFCLKKKNIVVDTHTLHARAL